MSADGRIPARQLDPTGGAPGQTPTVSEDGTVVEWGDSESIPAAADVTYAGSTNLAATNVEAALDELDTEKATAADLTAHLNDTTNPHAVTKAQVGLGSVDNTSDVDKPLSTATQTALDAKAGAAAVGCTASTNIVQSIPHNTNTAINFNLEKFDTAGFHDTATNNTRLTIPAGMNGVYSITAQIRYVASTTGYRGAVIKLNGASELANTLIANATVATTVFTGCVVYLADGDYVELNASQNSGNSVDITANGSVTYLSAIRIGS